MPASSVSSSPRGRYLVCMMLKHIYFLTFPKKRGGCHPTKLVKSTAKISLPRILNHVPVLFTWVHRLSHC
jgi:hypothetical protein